MENVGESGARNREFADKFSRVALIKGLIDPRVSRPVILDVGAHKGESARFLRAQFPTALIHSFEPLPSSFAQLRELGDPQLRAHNLALSDADGTIEFFENKISHTNSIFRVNEDSRDSLFFAEQRRSGQPVGSGTFNVPRQVRSMRLASFCEQEKIEHIDLLKLDVQGAERKVLDGAAAYLQQIDSVVLEIMFFDYYEHQGSFLEMESVLQPAGFRLFSISEISNNPMNGRTDWVEAIYRRQMPR
jgi:FkbM family methyltransferase